MSFRGEVSKKDLGFCKNKRFGWTGRNGWENIAEEDRNLLCQFSDPNLIMIMGVWRLIKIYGKRDSGMWLIRWEWGCWWMRITSADRWCRTGYAGGHQNPAGRDRHANRWSWSQWLSSEEFLTRPIEIIEIHRNWINLFLRILLIRILLSPPVSAPAPRWT